jgi:predicted transcriptional regulator
MSVYVEYDLGKGASILVEAPDNGNDEIVHASRDKEGIVTVKAKKNLVEALKDVKTQAKILLKEIEDLNVNEAEVKFGLTTIGEVGNIAIGKVGMGINYEITLKWKKPEPAMKQELS